jgi:hypothetical protein
MFLTPVVRAEVSTTAGRPASIRQASRSPQCARQLAHHQTLAGQPAPLRVPNRSSISGDLGILVDQFADPVAACEAKAGWSCRHDRRSWWMSCRVGWCPMNDGYCEWAGQSSMIGWSWAVVDGLARQIRQGHLRDQLGWLPRLTWSGLLVVCGDPAGAARSGWALPPRLRHRPRGSGWVWRSRRQLPYTVVIVVCGCVANCVTHHGRPRTWVAPGGCLNRSYLRKCAGQGTMVIASGRRGRGFKSRHPDTKTAGQKRCAIE